MISKELKTVTEYYEKECWEGSVFLKLLENTYPNLFHRTIEHLKSICELNGDNNNYTEEELYEIFFASEIIEIFEELYFEDKPYDDDIIINYYVKDENYTDYGVETRIMEDGYKLI